jgi:hypothetical protein
LRSGRGFKAQLACPVKREDGQEMKRRSTTENVLKSFAKSVHFLLISAQNTRISVNFCAFLTIFGKSLFRIQVLIIAALIKILVESLKNQVSNPRHLATNKLPDEGSNVGK